MEKFTCQLCGLQSTTLARHITGTHKLSVAEYKERFQVKAIAIVNPNKISHGNKVSVYSLKYWTDKGYTEEDAKYQIAIRRPTNILYWINKGYTEVDASNILKKQSAKGYDIDHYIKKYGEEIGRQKYQQRRDKCFEVSNRCVKYWTNKGYSEEDAIKQVKNVQNTRSYIKAIDKYGYEDGIKYVQDINTKWQTSLKSKTELEKREINIKKNSKSIEFFIQTSNTPVEDYIKSNYYYHRDTKRSIYKQLIDILDTCITKLDFIKFLINNNTSISYIKRIVRCAAMQLKFTYGKFGDDTIDVMLCKIYNELNIKKNVPGLYGNRYLYNGDMLLSDSEFQIANYLYNNNISYVYSGQYPFSTSSKRYYYDFYIPKLNLYVEFAGILDDSTYAKRIQYKKDCCIEHNLSFIISDSVTEILTNIKQNYDKIS